MKFTLAIAMCDPAHYLPLAQAAERAGWDAVAIPDGPFYPERVGAGYPYTPDGSRFWAPETPFLDPWVAIPAMAAVTSRLFFYTMVLKLPIRQPLLVAKAVGSAAVLSGDRVGLGVGLSWIPEEFEWLGSDYATRGARTDEAIAAIRACLAGGWAEYHGRFYDFGRLQMSPAPRQPVPIYVGGMTKPGFRRAARLGDGWISVHGPVEELTESIAGVQAALRDADRDPAGFEIKVIPIDALDRSAYDRLADLGATDAIVMPWWFYGGNPDRLDDQLAAVDRFAETVIAG
jgi:probable F420-dependent oxidoreductase